MTTTATHGATPQPSVAAPQPVNIATHLTAMAERHPDKNAVVWTVGYESNRTPRYAARTFAQLEKTVNRYANALTEVGIGRETRTVLFVKPGFDFFALVFALLKIGAVSVMIDPGLGARRMAACIADIDPQAFIGIPVAHVLRLLSRRAFRSVTTVITVGRRWCWGGHRLVDIAATAATTFPPAKTQAADPAAILFTSGSTGPAKGVLYNHGVFEAQVRYLNSHFGYGADEIDLPTFPLFALFDAALGMTAVIPDMDFSRPGGVDPQRIIQPICDHGCTHMFGSPALLDRLSRYGRDHDATLPTIRRIITAGAPVQPAMLARLQRMIPAGAEIHTPYGATEALPVASIASREILDETAEKTANGAGTCVGKPMTGTDVRIIAITDRPIEAWSDDLVADPGSIGEIVVRGPAVTREYYNNPDATRLAKIIDGDTFWHRMGDLGYFDAQGRLWFCGRKAHRVETETGTLFTVPCEAIFNQHEKVRRSALVGVGERGAQRPVMCIELEPDHRAADRTQLTRELLDLAQRHEHTNSIATVLYHPQFPVDVRHNAKIFREKLKVWAAGKAR